MVKVLATAHKSLVSIRVVLSAILLVMYYAVSLKFLIHRSSEETRLVMKKGTLLIRGVEPHSPSFAVVLTRTTKENAQNSA